MIANSILLSKNVWLITAMIYFATRFTKLQNTYMYFTYCTSSKGSGSQNSSYLSGHKERLCKNIMIVFA